MVDNGKIRAVVIYHPDFQKPGKGGIEEARNVGEQFLLGLKSDQMLDLIPEDKRDHFKKHVQGFKVYVKKLDKGVLG